MGTAATAAMALLLVVAASRTAAAADYCGAGVLSVFTRQGWSEVVQWDGTGTSISPTCWEAAVPGIGTSAVSVVGTLLPTALVCTTAPGSGNSTVLMWLDGMSMPDLPGTPLPCPYDGYYAIAVYSSQRTQLYFQASAGVSGSPFAAAQNYAKRPVSDDVHNPSPGRADLRRARVEASSRDDWCTFEPYTIPMSGFVNDLTAAIWWWPRGTQLKLLCFRATVSGSTVWPVETWVACASNLYDGAGNVTLIGRLPSNYLPNGATKTFKCPFTGHFALFMRSLEPPRVADLNVTVMAHASTDNATAQVAVPRPLDQSQP